MNSITNPVNNKFIKIFKRITLIFLTIIIVFVALFVIFPESVGNTLSKVGFFDLVFGDKNFRTSAEHQKALGIKTANMSGKEEKELNSMINESIKAQLEYYSTEKDESLEEVKNLYLAEEFERYKEYVKLYASFQQAKNGNQSYDKIEKIKFSPPRTYKDLPDRIGIITFIKFNYNYNYSNDITQIFIFKNINGEWKIEKHIEVNIQLGATEASLIEEIIDPQKYK